MSNPTKKRKETNEICLVGFNASWGNGKSDFVTNKKVSYFHQISLKVFSAVKL